MKSFKPQDEHFDSFKDLVEARELKYTLPFKKACQELKCSREWVTRYVRPNVKVIYLPNGYNSKRPNYAAIVAMRLGKSDEWVEQIYIDEAEFREFISRSIVRCQKRTKRVFRSGLIQPDLRLEYADELLRLVLKVFNTTELEEINEIFDDIDLLFIGCSNHHTRILLDNMVSQLKRTDAEWGDVPKPETKLEKWKTVPDMMDYGDTKEPIYRDMFREGVIRVELSLPDKDGVVSSKVYYLDDPNPIENYPLKFSDSIRKRLDKEQFERAVDFIYRLDEMTVKQVAWDTYKAKVGMSGDY